MLNDFCVFVPLSVRNVFSLAIVVYVCVKFSKSIKLSLREIINSEKH
jgi:hypothetical protein